MADKTDKTRINFGALALLALSFISLLACYLIYSLLPVSDSFTNSPDYSGAQTVNAFMASPVLALIALLSFLLLNVIFRKYFSELALSDNTFGKEEIKPSAIKITSFVSSVVLTCFLALSTVFAFLLWGEYKKLGFVAPVTDTRYESYGIFMLVNCIIYFFLFILTAVKMAGVRLPDLVAGLLKKDKEVKA